MRLMFMNKHQSEKQVLSAVESLLQSKKSVIMKTKKPKDPSPAKEIKKAKRLSFRSALPLRTY